ncbi:MAG: DUF4091 domain-containing protein, partial [Victivallales bacterium]|nr:DUF4091 domain-containing protein [Victivallales bacterium]
MIQRRRSWLVWLAGASALLGGVATVMAGGVAGWVSPMLKVGSEEKISCSERSEWSLTALRNEHESAHLLLTADAAGIDAATVRIGDFSGPNGAKIAAAKVRIRRAHYLHLTRHVPRPVWLPDALPPYEGAFAVAPNRNQSLYFDVEIPADAVPGAYCASVELTLDRAPCRLSLSLQVLSTVLPSTPSGESAYALWGEQPELGRWRTEPQHLAPYPQIAPGSDAGRRLYERLYWFLIAYRVQPDDLPVPPDSPEADRFLNDPRVKSYRIHYDPSRPEEFVARCRRLRALGRLPRGYVYTLDEPLPQDYQKCVAYSEKLHALVPDIRWVLTMNTPRLPVLESHVDIWCPVLSQFDPDYFRTRKEKGETVWWYTCCNPGPPYPTYLIADAAISPRLLGWLQAKYEVGGMLYWATNIWYKYDPDRNRYVPRDIWRDPSAFPKADGDGYLFYPAADPAAEPIPSLRLEMIRQGNEDLDTLALLRSALDAAARQVGYPDRPGQRRIYEIVNRIAPGMTDFTKDPAELETTRLRVLDELENLRCGVPAVITT